MSQKITIAEIEIKTGKNEKGDWTSFIITGTDKTRASTFDNQASNLKVGDIVDAELEVKGKYVNIKSFSVVGHAEIEKPAPPNEEMTKTDWAEKDRITRKSIERQKALEMAITIYTLPEKVPAYDFLALAKIFEQYLEDGSIPLGVIQQALQPKSEPSADPVSDNLPEEPEEAPETRIPTTNMDIGWLKESLGILQTRKVKGWANANVLSYLEALTGKEAKTIVEAVNNLTSKQTQAFKKRVQEALEMSES